MATVKKQAVKHAKRAYLKQDCPSSGDELEDTLLSEKPKHKRKVHGEKGKGQGERGKGQQELGERKFTISMSGMMVKVMEGQDLVLEGQRQVEKRVTGLEQKLEEIIKTINTKLANKDERFEVPDDVSDVPNEGVLDSKNFL